VETSLTVSVKQTRKHLIKVHSTSCRLLSLRGVYNCMLIIDLTMSHRT
jgi:hypothetical protein